VACTVYAARVQELKARINRKDPSFQLVYNAFDELMGCKRLSRTNIIWARKKLVEFRDAFPDEDSKRLLGKLELRVEHAATKWQKRDDERAAAKAAGQARGRGRRKQQTPAAPEAPPASPVELWKAMLAKQQEQQEKKS
jgi:hypothetical protein